MAHYFDTSALVELVVPGGHSDTLRRWWSRRSGRTTSSRIARTELVRSARRLDPVSLRSLDAIHLAAALDLGSSLEGFVTYDERLAAAARRYGVAVVGPR